MRKGNRNREVGSRMAVLRYVQDFTLGARVELPYAPPSPVLPFPRLQGQGCCRPAGDDPCGSLESLG